MNIDIITERLKNYGAKTKQEEINAIKEIYQEIALCGLARGDFFKYAAFQGGTCLRILYGLKRFSEDLDFILLATDPSFKWEKYLKAIELEFNSLGLTLEIFDYSNTDSAVKKALLKEHVFRKLLMLKHDLLPSDKQIIKIKLEVDVNPPNGSTYETKYLDYPYPFSILCQDLPTLFATKIHSIFCRKYSKGRDWFDFLWYVSKKASINYTFLQAALFQTGPFKNKKIIVDKDWVIEQLKKKIDETDWKEIKQDIAPFLKADDQRILQEWNKFLFHAMLQKFSIS